MLLGKLVRPIFSTILVGGILLPLLGGGACSPMRYTYNPVVTTRTTSAELDGRTSAVVAVDGSGSGEIQLSPLGLQTAYLYLRMRVTNRSREEWTIEHDDQRVEMKDEGGCRVTYNAISPAIASARFLTIRPGDTVTTDLVFPLGSIDAAELPAFAIQWRIHTLSRTDVFAGRVMFRRDVELRDRYFVPSVHDVTPTQGNEPPLR